MKAQYLKELLKCNYTVADHGEYIGVGSSMCHDLIKLDKATMKVSYALDTWHRGKECLKDKDDTVLLDIWNKLEELVESGEIKAILEENDIIENPLEVYYEQAGEVIKTYCSEYGWPNTTIEGRLMYENDHFKNPIDAAKDGLRDAELGITGYKKLISDKLEELNKFSDRVEFEKERYVKLKDFMYSH